MKINQFSQKSKQYKLMLGSFLLVILFGIGAIVYFNFIKPAQLNNASDPETPALEVEDRPVGEVDYGTPSADEENPTLDPPVTNSPQPGSSIPVSITYTGGSPLQVRVLISEVLPSGSCNLTVTKGSSQITSQTVNIFNTSNSTTCQGFTIDSGLVSTGTYKFTVTIDSEGRKGTVSKEVSF